LPPPAGAGEELSAVKSAGAEKGEEIERGKVAHMWALLPSVVIVSKTTIQNGRISKYKCFDSSMVKNTQF